VNQILHQNFNGDTNKLCYSTFLGEKEESELDELLSSLENDKEFQEIFEEFKAKENIFLGFLSLDDKKKLEIMVKCYFIVRQV
jgi:hypothetical protein